MFGCKCCEALKSENEYLRGLVDRCMVQIAPKPEEKDVTEDIIPEEQ